MRIHDKPHFIKYGMTALLVSMSLTAWAETLTSQVVGVADGDTITVLDANNEHHKIRLAGIDAPEKNQP
jgi:endonuclease YncB( thermonuclease family)